MGRTSGAASQSCFLQMTTWPLVQTASACRPRLRNISFAQGLEAGGFRWGPQANQAQLCSGAFARLLGGGVGPPHPEPAEG